MALVELFQNHTLHLYTNNIVHDTILLFAKSNKLVFCGPNTITITYTEGSVCILSNITNITTTLWDGLCAIEGLLTDGYKLLALTMLPPEIVVHIFSYLPLAIAKILRLNKYIQRICKPLLILASTRPINNREMAKWILQDTPLCVVCTSINTHLIVHAEVEYYNKLATGKYKYTSVRDSCSYAEAKADTTINNLKTEYEVASVVVFLENGVLDLYSKLCILQRRTSAMAIDPTFPNRYILGELDKYSKMDDTLKSMFIAYKRVCGLQHTLPDNSSAVMLATGYTETMLYMSSNPLEHLEDIRARINKLYACVREQLAKYFK